MVAYALCLNIVMLTVIFTDITRYIIPNWLVLILLALYPVLWLISPAHLDILWPLGLAVGMFILGFGMFALRVMGGGDIKLLTVTALYIGKATALDFMIGVGLIGGLATIALVLARPLIQLAHDVSPYPFTLPRVLKKGQPVPYGVAIAGAFLWLLWDQQLPGITW